MFVKNLKNHYIVVTVDGARKLAAYMEDAYTIATDDNTVWALNADGSAFVSNKANMDAYLNVVTADPSFLAHTTQVFPTRQAALAAL